MARGGRGKHTSPGYFRAGGGAGAVSRAICAGTGGDRATVRPLTLDGIADALRATGWEIRATGGRLQLRDANGQPMGRKGWRELFHVATGRHRPGALPGTE